MLNPHKGYADTWGFQPNHVTVRPLYTITHEEKNPSYRIGAYTAPTYPTAPAIAVRPYCGMQSTAHGFGLSAWKGNISSIGAAAPLGASITINTSGRTIRKNMYDKPDPGPNPIGDTPYWLFAGLLLAYCGWKHRKKLQAKS